MAIEGPLRELGIHDVFQLLDLSRKTGRLLVTSELRDNEGRVLFKNGSVVGATIKSNPHRIGEILLRAGKVTEGDIAKARSAQLERGDKRRLGEILVEMGSVSARELEKHMRGQIEAVVFELLSWREGFFRFEEGTDGDGGAAVHIPTASLLMEGARRIDEWSRIADRVPSLAVIPVFAPVTGDTTAGLDLLPNEWEVLTLINGELDLRAIAEGLNRSDFDVAKIVYGLVSTGVVELKVPRPSQRRSNVTRVATPSIAMKSVGAEPMVDESPTHEQVDDLERGFAALRSGDFDGAMKAWGQLLQTHPSHPMAEQLRAGLEAASRLRGLLEAQRGD